MSVCIIIAVEHDIHADAIVDRLRDRALVIRIDPFDVLPLLKFFSNSNEAQIGLQKFNLDDVTGILCRVALEAVNFTTIVDPIEKFAATEHFNTLIGILLNIPKSKWINFPWAEALAEGKIYPLNMAMRVGISVPPFLVSSLSADLLDFEASHGPCVIKPLSDMSIAKQDNRFVEVPDMADFSAPYTSDFLSQNLSVHDADELTPTLIQKKIKKMGDVRAVIIDGKVFSTYLRGNLDFVDSRLTPERDEVIFSLDEALTRKLQCLVHQILNLRFSAIDFVCDLNGDLHLVDLNPSGNWLWQEQSFGLPISTALSKGLLSSA